jgi:ABC-2 type transport system permease protein
MVGRVWALVRKEFAQISRDAALLFILVWAFTGAIYTTGRGRAMEITNVATVIYDLSQSKESRDLISHFQRPYFKVLAYLDRDDEVAVWLDSGRATIAVIVPPEFHRQVAAGEQGRLQVITDGAMAMPATIAIAYIAQISSAYSIEVLKNRTRPSGTVFANLPSVDERLRVEFNPNLLSTWFSSLLELFNQLTMVSLLLTAANMVREKEHGTLEQLMVSPARPVEIFLAKILPTLVIVLGLSLLSIMLVLKPVFAVPIRGSLVLFYSVAALYVFAMTSLGIAIAMVARNLSQAVMIMMLVLVPMIFLSGAWNPPEAMDPWLRWASLVSPMRYFIDFGYSVLFKGNGIEYVWRDVVGMLVLGGLLFGFSIWWFQRQISK